MEEYNKIKIFDLLNVFPEWEKKIKKQVSPPEAKLRGGGNFSPEIEEIQENIQFLS
jgi:hypothetical protein